MMMLEGYVQELEYTILLQLTRELDGLFDRVQVFQEALHMAAWEGTAGVVDIPSPETWW